jgi:hypothetical protein
MQLFVSGERADADVPFGCFNLAHWNNVVND